MSKIIINPGHGGVDPGALKAGYEEEDLALVLSWLLGGVLTHAGYECDIQREGDQTLQLNQIGAAAIAAKGNFMCSVHTDSNAKEDAHGCTTYYFPGDTRSKPIAEAVVNELAAKIGFQNRGAREANFQVLRDTRKVMPAVLVECGFISNAADRAELISLTGAWKIANGIAGGIIKSFK